ncbi:GNAT family N-acetyltransferase [Pararhodobacter aggregans]|uniref:GNAT family N-acetyltransferase n=1 Tax=Pararhodobacter aggregans TaxID=404875 RepID=UPI000D42A503|nr:GNAT family N-acetyltransferase [Pararhodobacter aggregans]PTX03480.1 acetyltransferase (GNAT) family protein [Pararhodobacter aggregans]
MIRVVPLQRAAEAAPLLRVLRATLDDATFALRLERAEAQGYRVLAALDGSAMVGALGYRLSDDLTWGRTLYVDDLVVAPDRRSSGIGRALLAEARAQAATSNCDHLRLCSGLSRIDAHRFYEANGLQRFSLQFVARMEE